MQKNSVVIIATEGLTTDLLYESLAKNLDIVGVYVEPHESKKSILKRRFKRLGLFKTLGQILFLTIVHPFIPSRKERIKEILKTKGLIGNKIDSNKTQQIPTVHDPELIALIKSKQPDLVFINGTRILKKVLLTAINCPIVNIHVGITPKYRGVHGGYWAKHNEEPELFGVTLHYVDAGIDTGKIIAQRTIDTNSKDNFKTYPLLQYVEGLALFKEHQEGIFNNTVQQPTPLTDQSQLYYHPTWLTYLFGKK